MPQHLGLVANLEISNITFFGTCLHLGMFQVFGKDGLLPFLPTFCWWLTVLFAFLILVLLQFHGV
jgi:preprotein translocase subunit SecG